MPTARSGFNNLQYHYEETVVTVSSNGGTTAVVFDTAYEIIPSVAVVAPRGAAGTYSAASVTKTGFTLTVASETNTAYDDNDVSVIWFAHERN